MDDKRYINPNNPVYISYAWANNDFPHLEDGVNALCKLLEENNIFYKRDKKNLCPYRWSISKAENEIGEGTAVIVVVSKRYVESLHCMHEWHLIRENGKIWKRVFPIVLDVVLAILVVVMFLIAASSENDNIINYKRNVTNRFSSWEQELTERERKVREAEKNLGIESPSAYYEDTESN